MEDLSSTVGGRLTVIEESSSSSNGRSTQPDEYKSNSTYLRSRIHIRSQSLTDIPNLPTTLSDNDRVKQFPSNHEYIKTTKIAQPMKRSESIEVKERLNDDYHIYKYSRCFNVPSKEAMKESISLGIEYDRYRSLQVNKYISSNHQSHNSHLTISQYCSLVVLFNINENMLPYLRTLIDLLKQNRGRSYDLLDNGQRVPYFAEYFLLIHITSSDFDNDFNENCNIDTSTVPSDKIAASLRKVEIDPSKTVILAPIPMYTHSNFHFFQLKAEKGGAKIVPRDDLKNLTESESLDLFTDGMYRRMIMEGEKRSHMDFYIYSISDLLLINLDTIAEDE